MENEQICATLQPVHSSRPLFLVFALQNSLSLMCQTHIGAQEKWNGLDRKGRSKSTKSQLLKYQVDNEEEEKTRVRLESSDNTGQKIKSCSWAHNFKYRTGMLILLGI